MDTVFLNSKQSDPGSPEQLRKLYQQLSSTLNEIQDRMLLETRMGERICCAIIEDDLLQMIEELEGYLIGEFPPTREQWEFLQSRAACVVEEMESLRPMALRAKRHRPRIRSIRSAHPRPERPGMPS